MPRSIEIGGFTIYLYGAIIAIGMISGLAIARWQAKRTGQNPDSYVDLAMIAIVCSLIGARLYYVAFMWDQYKDNPLKIFNIREGGLAIYGGVIAAILTTFVFTRIKKLNFLLVCDTACLGLVLGQAIGRWGNFCNREAFGGYADHLLAMQLPVSAVRQGEITAQQMEHIVVEGGVSYIQVHPTFLYESLWNIGLLLALIAFSPKKRFDGQVFLFYLAGYGIGRFWIEGLRTDQLLIPGIGYPVSQAVSLGLTALSLILMLVLWKRKKI